MRLLFERLAAWLDRLRPLSASGFVLRYRPGDRLRARGRVPMSRVGAITAFFDDELRPTGPVTVSGELLPGRAVRLRIAGPLDTWQRQRLRNVLVDLLAR